MSDPTPAVDTDDDGIDTAFHDADVHDEGVSRAAVAVEQFREGSTQVERTSDLQFLDSGGVVVEQLEEPWGRHDSVRLGHDAALALGTALLGGRLPTEDERESAGLFGKYRVFEGTTPVDDCFVLEPSDDRAARAALATYAMETSNDQLAEDIWAWLSTIDDGLTEFATEETQHASEEMTVAELLSLCGSASHESNDKTLEDLFAVLGEAHPAVAGRLVEHIPRAIDQSAGTDRGTWSSSEHPDWHAALNRTLEKSAPEGYDAE